MARETGAVSGSLIGLRLKGRYRIVGEIGAGVGGKVCQAEDDATGHRIAVRLLPKALAGSNGTQTLQRMSRSVIAVSAAHSGLASVLAFGESEGWPFAVMELVEGRRLSDVLASGGQLEIGDAMRWALDLGGAIETLHNMGLVHGAVRPRNVVILDDGRAKLLDVELAGLRDAPALIPTPGREVPAEYLPPEYGQGTSLTEKADIYSFATVLYQMLTGAPPFRGVTREAVREQQTSKTPAPMRSRRRSCPAAVDAVVAMALAPKPGERPLMQDLLNRIWSETNEPTTSRRRWVAIVGGATLVATLVGLGAWGFVAWRALAPRSPEPVTLPAAREFAAPSPPAAVAPAHAPVAAPTPPPAFAPAPIPVPAPPPAAPPAPAPTPPVVAPAPVRVPEPAPAPQAEPRRPVPPPEPRRVAPPPEPQRPTSVAAPTPPAPPAPAPTPPVVAPAPVRAPEPAPAREAEPRRPVPQPEPQRPASVAAPTPPPVPPPARAVPPAPRPAPGAGGERVEPPRAERGAPSSAPPRAATPSASQAPSASPARPAPPRPEGHDPNAVIDWLLNPSSTGRRD